MLLHVVTFRHKIQRSPGSTPSTMLPRKLESAKPYLAAKYGATSARFFVVQGRVWSKVTKMWEEHLNFWIVNDGVCVLDSNIHNLCVGDSHEISSWRITNVTWIVCIAPYVFIWFPFSPIGKALMNQNKNYWHRREVPSCAPKNIAKKLSPFDFCVFCVDFNIVSTLYSNYIYILYTYLIIYINYSIKGSLVEKLPSYGDLQMQTVQKSNNLVT